MSSFFGLDSSDRIFFIGEVARGLACGCRCVVCKEPLIARQGSVREHHFAHASGAEPCDSSYESMLHAYAKQVIQESRGLVIPLEAAAVAAVGIGSVDASGWLALTRVDVEKRVQAIRPDLLATTHAGVLVAIEVAYSSFCDTTKVAEFERNALPVLEIDLRRFSAEGFDPEKVRGSLLRNVEGKAWLWPGPADEQAARGKDNRFGSFDHAPLPEVKARLPEQIIAFSGRWVSVKQFSSGDIAVKVVRYDPDLVSLVKTIAKANYGSYSPTWQSWTIPRWRAAVVRSELERRASTTAITLTDSTIAQPTRPMGT
jgi:competence protein CoiA